MIFCYVSVVFFVLFFVSFVREKRRFRNAVYLLCAILNLYFYSTALMISTGNIGLNLFVVASVLVIVPIGVLTISVLFMIAGVITIKREGFRLPNLLALAFGGGIWIICILFYLAISNYFEYKWIKIAIYFSTIMALYIGFTFAALVIYSVLYCIFPKGKKFDYIIVHGAGLSKGEKVTPLLKRRIDKGIQAFNRLEGKAKIIVSGGKGSDEKISEAEAMKRYILENNISEENIICEDKSTTTFENLMYSKKIMDSQKKAYRCIFVTNNYHVFRTGLYAKKLNIKAEGLGCTTAMYYWPSAFIREYIAIMLSMKWYSIFILGLALLLLILT
ncbi:YdcF family protein [Clostridium felsineum]|uniref:Uncharacterized protein n=2 Tax=Clostridium felsineum TaxID=36839 RepID=A0A1S8M7E6_9CLOT|nr:YdcF family protein [Clostridium felsineum]URZ01911.1 hypothetical protein CLAUR_019080 [Clostridium felsineum]URZ05251.1 hypothetical protein CLROS_005750 [Clostridium felsineum]URZ10292.1 hypothetical protein CROST_010000 [Clostridium felsineum]